MDLEGIDAHCADLAKNKVPFAFINGTTGDSMSLSVKERKAIAEAWVAAGKKYGVKITNHIAAASIEDSKELAAHAEAIGCVMIGAMPPYFFKPGSPMVVAQWMKEIGAAAPKTPLYYYHFPVITGVPIDPFALIKAIEAIGVPTFRGMKFTDYNLWCVPHALSCCGCWCCSNLMLLPWAYTVVCFTRSHFSGPYPSPFQLPLCCCCRHFANCVQYDGGKYDIAYGRDEAILGGMATGAKASIGNAFCFAAGVCHRIRKAFFAGDLATARIEQGRVNSFVNVLTDARFGGNLLVTARHVMEMKGIKMGPPRQPHVPMTPEQVKGLEEELKAIRFFEWCD